MANKKKRSMTNADLRRLIVKWQKRLRLMDWDIDAEFDTEGVLLELEAWALCRPQGFIRSATLTFQHPEIAREMKANYDLEECVVHELLHIFFAGIRHRDYAGLMLEEQMVYTLAIMLVMLERQGKKAGRATSFDSTPEAGARPFCCSKHSFKKESYQEDHHCGY